MALRDKIFDKTRRHLKREPVELMGETVYVWGLTVKQKAHFVFRRGVVARRGRLRAGVLGKLGR